MYIWRTHHARVKVGRAGGSPLGKDRVGGGVVGERLQREGVIIRNLEERFLDIQGFLKLKKKISNFFKFLIF